MLYATKADNGGFPMQKLVFILTLLLAAPLCQTAAAEAPDVRLFRSLREVLCGIRPR